MVDFHNPTVIAQDVLATFKLWHAVLGLYIWEFFTTIEYEWDVIRGRLPYRWTIWVYSLARVAALLAAILRFDLMDNRSQINCQVAFSFVVVLSFISTSAASLLIVLRVIAIWNRNKVVVAAAVSIWGINVAFLIQGAARLRAAWVTSIMACLPVHGVDNTPTLISMLVTDIALLLIMLCGLFRLRHDCDCKFGLTQLLWKQGIIWLLIATVAEVPPVVFVILDLNGPLNIMFQPPSYFTVVIAATRIHRSLVDFTRRSTDVFTTPHEDIQNAHLPTPEDKRIDAVSSPIDQTEVAVHVISKQHCTPRIRLDEDSSVSTNEQMHDKPNGLSRDDDVERGT